VSLRLRVLLFVGLINIGVFGAGLAHLSNQLAEVRLAQQEETARRLVRSLQNAFSPEGELRVAQILEWPLWEAVTDAVIVDRNPSGVALNPVGAWRRGEDFDRAEVQRSIDLAVARLETVPAAGGLVLPVLDRRGRAWGGCWFRLSEDGGARPLWMGLLPWFFASTGLLFAGTYTFLRRFVLRPVDALARAARDVQRGDFTRPLPAPRYADELGDLIVAFNSMALDVRRYRESLEQETEAAKEQAWRAEAAALRQRRLAAMGELASGIAHEINNPLGGMLNAVEAMERPDLAAERRVRYLELLRGGLERIQGTVQNLLRFTPRQAPREPLDLAGPVRDAVELVRHRIESEGVTLELELLDPRARVLGERAELGQAVLNLLVNALDALEDAPGRRAVSVRLASEDGSVSLVVADTGPGIPQEDLERVSDLFYTTKEVGRGTGLGLALVHAVADQHGGQLQLRNGAAGGLEAELRLPRAAGEERT
jgi:signal transduction histidine kinase